MIDRVLQQLEAESIEIIWDAVASGGKAVMLTSLGKDSSVMLHLARKAFAPSPVPFPLMHIDTRWKFREMYAYREALQASGDVEVLVYENNTDDARELTPFERGSSYFTDVMKTRALRAALDHHGFQVVFGGARRDEERSRAKERVFSVRTREHRWDPRHQRPELWRLYNTHVTDSQSLRVFPLSNWTELDVWRYIRQEQIPVVGLYFAKPRLVVQRHGRLILIDDHRYPLNADEAPEMKCVRFRTLGCYPLTGAVESSAQTIDQIVEELSVTLVSERIGRIIDVDQPASMERKKREGYF